MLTAMLLCVSALEYWKETKWSQLKAENLFFVINSDFMNVLNLNFTTNWKAFSLLVLSSSGSKKRISVCQHHNKVLVFPAK